LPTERPSVAAILLAAGSASRFGGGKLLAALPDGRAIGLASYQNLQRAHAEVVVVVRSGDAKVRDLYRTAGARIVESADAAQGMSRSLMAGIRAAPQAAGWLVALADMPFVQSDTIRRVIRAIEAGALIAMPILHGRRGHPVAFARTLEPELLQLTGDEGARAVLQRHASEIQFVDCDDAGILRDIDTRDDLASPQHSSPDY
jgi:molybdenum cofactor cytidylyltransferase